MVTEKRLFRGFTLVELMIAVVIAAILATIAVPSYMEYVRKSRRAEAMESLYTLQLAQEKWRATNTAYGSLSDLGINALTSSGNYKLAIKLPASPDDQTSYTAVATAVTGTSQADDKANGVSCATMTVDQDGPVYDSPKGVQACWGK